MTPLDFTFNVPQVVGRQTYRVLRDPTLSAVVEVRKRDGAWDKLFSSDPFIPV